MTFSRKDAAAAALTALAVLVFLATHEGWGVPLVGDSHRWAAGAIFFLGSMTCGLGAGQGRGHEAARDPRDDGVRACRRRPRDRLADAALAARRRHGRAVGGRDAASRPARAAHGLGTVRTVPDRCQARAWHRKALDAGIVVGAGRLRRLPRDRDGPLVVARSGRPAHAARRRRGPGSASGRPPLAAGFPQVRSAGGPMARGRSAPILRQ